MDDHPHQFILEGYGIGRCIFPDPIQAYINLCYDGIGIEWKGDDVGIKIMIEVRSIDLE